MITSYKYEGKKEEDIIIQIEKELGLSINELFIDKIESEGNLFKSKKINMVVLKYEDVIKFIKNYIENLSTSLNLHIHSEVRINDEIVNIILISENNAMLIGKDGKTLNAIQTLLRQALKNQSGINIKLNIDASNYKAKKQKNLEYEIKKIADEILKSHVQVKLDPMNSYERRIVHTIISTYSELSTESVGESPNRYILISYKED